jgi:hypothetical protein
MTDAPDRVIEQWSLKDGLVAIPFIASALALTWEVGYFLKIGGGSFGLFSLAEHITFAIQALPAAIAVTIFAALGVFAKFVDSSLVKKPRSVLIRILGYVATVIVALGIFFWFSPGDLDLGLVILSFLVAGPLFFFVEAPPQILKKWIVNYVGILCLFVLAFGFGFESARTQMQSHRPLSAIRVGEKGKETETEIKVRILRTGERGVLYFDPVAQGFGFLLWDSVKRIDWATSPLFPRQ